MEISNATHRACPEIRALSLEGSDTDEVVRLAAELSEEEDPDEPPPDRATVLANFGAEIDEHVAHWGAWSGALLVGMCEYRRSTGGRAGDRIGMFVSRSFRRRGIGRSLLGVLIAHASRHGRDRLAGSTIDEVDGGAPFCQRIGADRKSVV